MGQVVLVRHGQASFGAPKYDLLSELGGEQGRLLGTWLAAAGVTPRTVISGGMTRHLQTAEAMSRAAGWTGTPIDVDRDWDEFDHLQVIEALPDAADAGTKDRRAFQRLFDSATARWTAGQHDNEYSESFSSFVDRVAASLDRACSREGPVVVVTSGGPIAAACAELVTAGAARSPCSLPTLWRHFNTVQVNAGVTRVLVGATGRRLLTFNEHAYLGLEHLSYR